MSAAVEDGPELVPLRLESIRIAYIQLGRRVDSALHTQIGDRARLHEQNSSVALLLGAIQQHSDVIPIPERQVMEQSVAAMLEALETATFQSRDIVEEPAVQVAHVVRTGRPGRPRIEIDYDFLAYGLDLRGPTGLAPVVGVNPRTVRRRALDYGLVEPAAPVYTETVDEETGETIRIYMSSTSGPVSDIADGEVDALMYHTLELFPAFGRRMIDGHFRALGYFVQASRIRESYHRVHGPPVSYASHPTGRRPYQVAGPNSLAHHDGQHGLRRWRIVIHAFIDGFSRFVTGIRASNNNRAATVLDLFLNEVVANHGVPRRVRGDHGTENVRVAQWMEERYGPTHGAYIWGRSTPNMRIEQQWLGNRGELVTIVLLTILYLQERA